MQRQTKPEDEFLIIIPPIVSWLSYGGLIPFVVLAIAVWVDGNHSSLWREALVGYGAVILSFVGALHWGFAMSQSNMTAQHRTRSFIWSVVPALMAWFALMLTPKYASAVLVVGFLCHFLQDYFLVQVSNSPKWYLPLRFRLTLVASAALFAPYFS